jgi:hypothetical protein
MCSFKSLIGYLCCAYCIFAIAQPLEQVPKDAFMEATLCLSTDQSMKALMSLEQQTKQPSEDGVIEVVKPIYAGDLCVKNVKITAAFGVMMTSGEACGGTATDFERFINKRDVNLRLAKVGKDEVIAPEKGNEIILASQVGRTKYSFAIGAWEFNPRGFVFTPSSKVRTFTCMYSSGSHN